MAMCRLRDTALQPGYLSQKTQARGFASSSFNEFADENLGLEFYLIMLEV
jgi:hypothetical protein